MSRRRFLGATGGAAGAVALAGCSGNGDGTDDTTTEAGTTTEETTTVEQEVYKPGSIAVEAVGEYELEIQIDAPFHASLQMLAYSSFSAVPEGVVGDVEGYDGEMSYEEFATSSPIGSGPFEFDNWTQGTEASVSAYDDYYGEAAALDSIHWQVLERDSARFNYAMNRNADLFTIPTSQYDPDLVSVDETDAEGRSLGTYGPVRNGDTLNYVGVPTINTFYIGFNMNEVPKPVRQAFAYAANQELLVNEVFKGRGVPAYHLTPPSIYPGGAGEYNSHAEENYPYGYNESRVAEARQVMEEAGYSADDPYEVQWTQYQSDTWLEMAQILRDQLASAHIDMQIEQADFSTLLQRGRNGNLEAYTLGWIADYPAPDNFLGLLDPPQTQTSMDAPVSYINWNSENGDAAQDAEDAYDVIDDNKAPTDDAKAQRSEAAVLMEEANWEDVGFINLYHRLDEYFWYDTIEYNPFGGMGISRQKYNKVTTTDQKDDNTLNRILTGTITTIDPIASTSTAGGEIISQVFDALTNYQDGTTTVTNLGAVDYSVSDDFLTYTFQLEEDATFHDGSDVTAQDYVYSLERLAGSENSRRSYFLLDTLGVSHETETVTVEQ
ncbi:ABC-type transport system, periplasmic component [Halanaeroarchaeum sp. HSR-CO]|nr:ABC-type transport system, periplasmic component [Halanaeroarchaeum sp. HSR-CO]